MGGGALRSASLLHYLARDHKVDVVVFRQPGATDPEGSLPPGLARRVLTLDLPAHRRGAAAKAWRNAVRLARRVPPLLDRFAGFGTPLESFLGETHYDVAVIEHFWCAPYVRQLAPRADRIVLDLHNVESVLHSACAAAGTGPAAAAHRIFARACREQERKWLPRFSTLLVASSEDADRIRPIAGVPV